MNAPDPRANHPAERGRQETEVTMALRDALRETKEKLQSVGVDAYLMGGVGAAVLAPARWPEDRPLSLDLDFLVADTDEVKEKILAIWPGAFRRNETKPVFKSTKLLASDGRSFRTDNGVELDFITESVIERDEGRMSLAVTPDLGDRAVSAALLGEDVTVLPASMLVAQKLYAGRGADVGKYDLMDAATLIEAGADPQGVADALRRSVSPADLPAVAEKLLATLSRLERTEKVTATAAAISRHASS